MPKVSLTKISSGYGSVDVINDNFDTIEDAFENTVSRDGTLPNSLQADLDANSQRIINLPDPIALSEPVTRNYAETNYTVAGASAAQTAAELAATNAVASEVAAALSETNAATSETNVAALFQKGADIASATTTDLGAVTGYYHDITVSASPITSFGTISAGTRKVLQFDGAITITYDATQMILPGNVSITTAAGDQCEAMSLGSGNWIVLWYTKDAATPVGQSLNTTDSPTFAAVTSTGLITATVGQIAFPATQVPSAGVNTLDDYEEGTWTPDLQFGGLTTGITYNARGGIYTKIGNLIFFIGRIHLSSKGSATGGATIAGLPYQSNTATDVTYFWAEVSWQTMVTAAVSMRALIMNNTQELSLRIQTAASTVSDNTQPVDTDFGNGTELSFTGIYLAD